jgi:uroporphyrinogen-III synthase
VRAVAAIADARGGRPLPERLWTAAVGESTADALRAAGARLVIVGRGMGARGLIPVLESADAWVGRRVLIPRAALGGRELAEFLRRMRARVDEVEAYRILPRPAQEIARSWRSARPEAAVITSSSAALALAGAVGPAALRELEAVVAIGPTTAATLGQLGVPAVMSDATDFASVAERARSALIGMAATDRNAVPVNAGVAGKA